MTNATSGPLSVTHNQRQTDSTVLRLSWKLEVGNREQDVGRYSQSEGKSGVEKAVFSLEEEGDSLLLLQPDAAL